MNHFSDFCVRIYKNIHVSMVYMYIYIYLFIYLFIYGAPFCSLAFWRFACKGNRYVEVALGEQIDAVGLMR